MTRRKYCDSGCRSSDPVMSPRRELAATVALALIAAAVWCVAATIGGY